MDFWNALIITAEVALAFLAGIIFGRRAEPGRLFHRHRMTVVARTWAPPPDSERRMQGDSEFLSRIMMGCTTYVIGCECGKTDKIEAVGREDRGVVEVKFREAKR